MITNAPPKRSLRRAFLLALIVLPCILASCASAPAYHPTAQLPREGAQVHGLNINGFIHSTGVYIDEVDGGIVKDPIFWTPHIPQNLALIDPGKRVLTLRGEYAGFWVKTVCRVKLTAELQANHDYQVQFERNGKLMTFWVEDALTHAPVSDRQTTNAITHFDPPPAAPVF